MGGTTLLEQIDDLVTDVESTLATLAAPDILDEVEEILDELPEEGINILPTHIDANDVCLAGLTFVTLPVVARGIGMPLSVQLAQRNVNTL